MCWYNYHNTETVIKTIGSPFLMLLVVLFKFFKVMATFAIKPVLPVGRCIKHTHPMFFVVSSYVFYPGPLNTSAKLLKPYIQYQYLKCFSS